MGIQRRATRAIALAGLLLFAASAALAADGSAAHVRAESQSIDRSFADTLMSAWLDARSASSELRRLEQFALTRNGQGLLAGLAAALTCLVILRIAKRRQRDQGVATIYIEFPEIVDGDFEVSLRRQTSRRAGPRGGGKPNAPTRTPSRLARSGVHRETQFDELASGSWYASIDGLVLAPRSRCELTEIHEEIEFSITPEITTSVRVELPPIEAHVELRIHWDRQPARDVGVSLRGHPNSLRYSGQGLSRITLALGSHEILVGGGDRVVERNIRIDDYEPKVVRVDLATSEGLVFKGCPPAVTSYLQGDLAGAARALERDGQHDLASVLFAQLHQEQGQMEHAAQQLENAGRIRQAADLRRSISDFGRAAQLYEDSGELREAAEMYCAAGCWEQGARIYAALEQWVEAAHAFEQIGDTNGLVGALEAQGKFLRAAALATEMDDRGRSIRLLQQVGPNDPDHGRASELLALAFEQEGHLDLAARQLEHSLELLGESESASQLELHLAELLDESDQWQHALGVLETLRDRDPTFPGVASRIEGLRKKLSQSERSRRDTPFDATPGATAFIDQARYEILEEIGRGGMGLVYRARDRRLGREVALKRMPENLHDHPAAISLFLREAQAAARMNHPNIVTLYDADQEQGQLFITMELLEGLPLNSLLKRHGPFEPMDTVRLGLRICAGLSYAHDQGIVHRDIKTSNIFITREKTLKIMDFGLAKMIEAVRDKGTSVIAGTPFYMAPEQSAGTAVDARTDLYGLGVTLYELSTGRLPFCEGNVSEQHRSAPRPDPSAIVAGYPLALARLIQRLMATSPEDRPASASDAARELQDCLDTSTVA